ncbi:DoxX family protein [Alkalimarinus coralli]|uniref:DoxX family protein n=1 Tax=Alkalimarinus coralli TaxID=2935863 RepID=UPI00202B87CC|nr:DoxX family protein [Alkalimarinus coralli]
MTTTTTVETNRESDKKSLMRRTVKLYSATIKWVDYLQPVLNVIFRLSVAKVFFMSGLTKIKSWDTTLMLFEYEYAVPVIDFKLAAILATGGELILPVLLVLGLAGRFGAAGLFILNFVAAISYPDISPAGIKDHYFWGAMLLVLVVYGPGKLSIDHLIKRKLVP